MQAEQQRLTKTGNHRTADSCNLRHPCIERVSAVDTHYTLFYIALCGDLLSMKELRMALAALRIHASTSKTYILIFA